MVFSSSLPTVVRDSYIISDTLPLNISYIDFFPNLLSCKFNLEQINPVGLFNKKYFHSEEEIIPFPRKPPFFIRIKFKVIFFTIDPFTVILPSQIKFLISFLEEKIPHFDRN